ncbi:MAG: MmgE/PrpD family protein [Alphaproteobacteria bacterium]
MPLDSSAGSVEFSDFTLKAQFDDIPGDVIARVQDLILDLLAVGAAADSIPAARIGKDIAVRQFNAGSDGDRARIMFDGRTASGGGAAYAGATQIDSLDAHDGFSLAKGHAGCGLLPGILAFAERNPDLSGREMLATMVLGYEIASRAGVALHGTVSDYHTSGAWVALAVAALGIRLAGADANTLRQAIGIAEYHGPRSQMMREIDNPTMLHDGSGWGSMVGVTAAELALAGFEGAPAITVEQEDAAPYWADLGQVWLTLNQNIKLYPICRWAHAPIKAALDLRAEHGITVDDVAAIEISSFHNATRLALDMPKTTGKAQYSISYPVAAALVFGEVGPKAVSGETFNDPEIARLVSVTTVTECDHCNANFPADRLGRTVVITKDGRRLDSGIARAPGEHPLAVVNRAGLIDKFRAFTHPVLGKDRASRIEDAVFALDKPGTKLNDLTALVYPAVG